MIEVRHLRKEYADVTPLEDVCADIRDGDVIAVIGPSGTGKSTLLRCINLLERPTSGSIRVDGEEILDGGCDISRLRQKVGMVFQSFNLFGHLTAIENVMRPQMDLLGRSKQEAYDNSVELLKSVGLLKAALKYPDEMSGGQRQRVAIARALAMDPEVILFDEPTSALDPAMVAEVETAIGNLAKAGRTMMIVTHEMRFARSVSNRVFYMDAGGIYEEGPTDQIFDNPTKELTRRFMRSLKVLEIVIDDPNFDFPGAFSRIIEYCSKNRIPGKTATNIQLIFEELLYQILLPELPEAGLVFAVEYSEADGTEVLITYHGEPIDLERTENKLALAIVKGVALDMGCKADGDKNLIRIRL